MNITVQTCHMNIESEPVRVRVSISVPDYIEIPCFIPHVLRVFDFKVRGPPGYFSNLTLKDSSCYTSTFVFSGIS